MKKSFVLSGWLTLCLLTATTFASPAKQLWTTPLGADAKWNKLTDLGILLVGTDAAIQAVSPEDGKVIWKREDIKKSNRNNACEVPGTPVLICNTYDGMMNSKVVFHAIDYTTGKEIWSTPQQMAQYLDTIMAPDQNLVIFVVNSMDRKENGIHFLAHDLATGEAKWATKFAKSNGIPLHMADNSGKFIPTMDLSGYHDPVFDGTEMYVGYLGIHCVGLTDGKVKWGVEFPPGAKGLKKTYAPLRIDGDRIYGAGGGSVYAINRRDGSTIWKSERISDFAGLFKARDNAIVSQIEIFEGKVFARYGGNFSDGKVAQLREPLGVLGLDPASGKPAYHFDDAKEGITNLALIPERKLVVFADGANVFGLDASAASPTVAFKTPIEFKRKMGMGGVAKIGLGALGGVSGLAKGIASANKGRLDVPVAISVQPGGHVIVQGKQHLLSFNADKRSIEWSLFYAAPSEALGNIAMFAVTAAAAVYGNAQAASSGGIGTSGYDSGVRTIHQNLDSYNHYTEKAAARLAQAKSTANYSYILTKLESKDIGVLGVNLASGETDRELPMKEKEPEYTVDEDMHRVFHFKGGDVLIGYQFGN